MRTVLGLPLLVAATLGVLIISVAEAWGGLATAADTGVLLTVLLLVLTALGVVLALAGRRSTSAWPRRVVGYLSVLAVALAAVMLVVTFRAHTASDRFADRAADLPLPEGYTRTSTTGVRQYEQQNPEHVVRAWRVPAQADACADIRQAFEQWADPPLQTSSRGGSCSVTSADQAQKTEIHLDDDGTSVVLEMWLEGSSLVEF